MKKSAMQLVSNLVLIALLITVISDVLLQHNVGVGAAAAAVSSKLEAARLLDTYLVHVPVHNKPAPLHSRKAWHQDLLSLAHRAAAAKFVNDAKYGEGYGAVKIPAIDNRLLYSYNAVFDGFAAQLTKDEAAALAELPEVSLLSLSKVLQLHTTHSSAFLSEIDSGTGISLSWTAAAATKSSSDVIVGHIDSGIWPESRSFSDDSGFPDIPARWKGFCENVATFNGTQLCNKKLIGARFFAKALESQIEKIGKTLSQIDDFPSPRDKQGHGTHTASTAVGSVVPNVSFGNSTTYAYATGAATGMAPLARLAVYKVCWNVYGCLEADILAAFDAAISDGVDVITVSMGSENGDTDFHTNSVSRGSLAAAIVGITTVASAGNDGPGMREVTNAAPWTVTVAASTIDRDFPATITVNNRTVFEGMSLYTGKKVDFRRAPPKVVYPGRYLRNARFCNNQDYLEMTDVVKGAVVLCYMSIGGGLDGVTKANVVKKAGGVGVILVRPDEDVWAGFLPTSTSIPTVMVGYRTGEAIRTKITAGRRPTTVVLDGFGTTRMGAASAPAMPAPAIAGFSSRGPSTVVSEILKPDITAPGVTILSSWSRGRSPSDSSKDFNIVSGTSMACPHAAGIIATLKSVHPTWTPAMLRSAITTTATTLNSKGGSIVNAHDGQIARTVDMGAGHINPNAALDPGLVYDVTPQDYVDFLCTVHGYNASNVPDLFHSNFSCNPNSPIRLPGDLNYPSFSVMYTYRNKHVTTYTFNRTLTNVGTPNSTYSVNVAEPYKVSVFVSPSTLTFGDAPLEKQTYSVTFNVVDTSPFDDDSLFFKDMYHIEDGSLTWSDGLGHNVRSPISWTWYKDI